MSINAPEHLPPLGSAAKAARENTDAFFDNSFRAAMFNEQTGPGGPAIWSVANAEDLQLNWNKVFPYQFMILKRMTNGEWVDATLTADSDKVPLPFTLPIPPQSISIDMDFASSVEATQGGIIEQHNGAPFRDIVLQGTTGVLPLRGVSSKGGRNTATGIVQGLFGGVAQAGQTAVETGKLAVKAAGVSITPDNVIPDDEFASTTPDSPAYGTGYYQFLLLKRYLEWYAEAKKQKAYADFALGFAIWKEREVYLVTPRKFTVSRNGGKALQYPYQIALRAWRRVVLKAGALGDLSTEHLPLRNPNAIAAALSAIDNARRVIEKVTDTVKAVSADIENIVLTPLREASLFCQASLGLAASVADIPGLVPSLEKSVMKIVKPDGSNFGEPATVESAAAKLGVQLGQSQAVDLDIQTLVTGIVGGYQIDHFTNPQRHTELWSAVKIDKLEIPDFVKDKLKGVSQRASRLRADDFATMRVDIAKYLAEYSSAVGVGDPEFDALYGATSVTPVRSVPTSTDWSVMTALNEAIGALDGLSASKSINNDVTSVDVIAGLATNAGLVFQNPRSKYLVPFPLGYTLEMVAAKYLGNPDRWIEIAALNGLVNPYVDEIGRTDYLVSNGFQNSVGVPTTNIFAVGQIVWLSGVGVPREKRRVLSVQTYNDFQVLQLDGDGDLSKFTVGLQSRVFSFIPNTTNSQQFIYIPSNGNPEDFDWQTKTIPGVDYFDPMVRVGGMDLQVDDFGDLVIVGGSTRLSVGLNNIIQQLKIGIGTPQGSLARHPEFGFGVLAGASVADVSAKQVLSAAKAFVKAHPAFTGVDYAAISQNGNSMQISLGVGVRGISKTIPITVGVQS